MLGIGQKLPDFKITGVKPGFSNHQENGVSAFETLDEKSFPGKWKVIFFYPKDFTFVCPTEIVEFARLARTSPTATRSCSAARPTTSSSSSRWRREHKDSQTCQSGSLPTPTAPSSTASACARQDEGVAYRCDLHRRPGQRDPARLRRTTSTSAAIRRKRSASSTRCRPTSFARATARSAATH